MASRLTFILGGARSGKSAYAEGLASGTDREVLYVATAEPGDEEMRARIAQHRSRRPVHWTTLEAPRSVGAAIDAESGDFEFVLVDCITLLVSNVILSPAGENPKDPTSAELDDMLDEEIDALLASCEKSRAAWIVVSNEVGLGLVPPSPVGRRYRDALGRVNQRLAAKADEVLLLVAGLPVRVK